MAMGKRTVSAEEDRVAEEEQPPTALFNRRPIVRCQRLLKPSERRIHGWKAPGFSAFLEVPSRVHNTFVSYSDSHRLCHRADIICVLFSCHRAQLLCPILTGHNFCVLFSQGTTFVSYSHRDEQMCPILTGMNKCVLFVFFPVFGMESAWASAWASA